MTVVVAHVVARTAWESSCLPVLTLWTTGAQHASLFPAALVAGLVDPVVVVVASVMDPAGT
jgi:hypothetical protein